ncbi:hypothetical protein AOQ84DRAFT_222729 [Glonium stellatum]|uniref:Uncharacterized protein n=1 Tax=Glonium stellatum TaxID=574774 RepID=A0A8E2JSB4_9PEZI|nr:hypothetical protein AOQ84DRAFT_222729 [Glonium stellatum]
MQEECMVLECSRWREPLEEETSAASPQATGRIIQCKELGGVLCADGWDVPSREGKAQPCADQELKVDGSHILSQVPHWVGIHSRRMLAAYRRFRTTSQWNGVSTTELHSSGLAHEAGVERLPANAAGGTRSTAAKRSRAEMALWDARDGRHLMVRRGEKWAIWKVSGKARRNQAPAPSSGAGGHGWVASRGARPGGFHHLRTLLARSPRRQACPRSPFPSSLQYPVARALPVPQRLASQTSQTSQTSQASHRGSGRLLQNTTRPIPNHRRSIEPPADHQPEYRPSSPIVLRLSHRTAESPSPALCTFVALGRLNFSLSSSKLRAFNTIAETLTHTASALIFTF